MKRVFCVSISALLLIYMAACSGNKQVRQPENNTLENEALRYSTRFQRNFSLARYSLALEDVLQAEAIYNALDMNRERAISLNNAGVVLERMGKRSEAEAAYRRSLAMVRSSGDTKTVVAALNNLAGILIAKDSDSALELAEEAEKISRKNGWSSAQAKATHSMAVLAMGAGDLRRAEELSRQALDLAARGGSKGTESASLVTLSRITAGSGDFEAAMKMVEEAISIDREREDPFSIAMDYRAKAFVQDGAGDPDGARESRDKAEEIFEFLGIEAK